MKTYQTILFDLDGTLTDPGPGITNSVAYALNRCGISVADKTTLYRFIGPPLKEAFAQFYGFSEEQAAAAVAYYREYFREQGIFQNSVYEGIEPLLQTLKDAGKTLLLATSKPEQFAKEILEHFGLARFFSVMAGATMDGTRSKKDEVILYALACAGISDPTGAIMVGDREYDILGASKVGMDAIGVLFGYGSREELTNAGAAYLAQSPAQIGKILLHEDVFQ